jgi:hypothetical protein
VGIGGWAMKSGTGSATGRHAQTRDIDAERQLNWKTGSALMTTRAADSKCQQDFIRSDLAVRDGEVGQGRRVRRLVDRLTRPGKEHNLYRLSLLIEKRQALKQRYQIACCAREETDFLADAMKARKAAVPNSGGDVMSIETDIQQVD